MIPDKIYLKIQDLGSGYAYEISLDGNEEHEYIRKDALIMWASNMLGQVSDMGFDDGDVEHGYTRALQDIIEHLNEI